VTDLILKTCIWYPYAFKFHVLPLHVVICVTLGFRTAKNRGFDHISGKVILEKTDLAEKVRVRLSQFIVVIVRPA